MLLEDAFHQHHLPVTLPLRQQQPRRNLWPRRIPVLEFSEELDSGDFELGFIKE